MARKRVKKPVTVESQGFELFSSVQTRRRDRATGQIVKSCNTKPKIETLIVDNLAVRVTYDCDANGEPSEVRVLRVGGTPKKKRGEDRDDRSSRIRYARVLKAEIRRQLQRGFEIDRLEAVATSEMRSESARKAAASRKRKAASGGYKVPTKAEADTQLRLISPKLEAATIAYNRARTVGTKRKAAARLTKLRQLRTHWLGVKQGRLKSYPKVKVKL